MRYKATIPYIDSMGSISPIYCQSTPMMDRHEDLLWELNSMRRHDGLREWTLEEYHDNVGYKVKFEPAPDKLPSEIQAQGERLIEAIFDKHDTHDLMQLSDEGKSRMHRIRLKLQDNFHALRMEAKTRLKKRREERQNA